MWIEISRMFLAISDSASYPVRGMWIEICPSVSPPTMFWVIPREGYVD